MGRSFWFECSRCGYRARVSGGADRGRDCEVQTICCRECRELYDAVVRLRVSEPPQGALEPGPEAVSRRLKPPLPAQPPGFPTVLTRLRVPGLRSAQWLAFKPQCPVAAYHRVQEWRELDPCPRCGYYLEKNPRPFRLWE